MDAPPNPFSILSLIVAPAVLTNASSVLVLSTGNRLARVVDRTRELTAALVDSPVPPHPQAMAKSRELAAVQQRMLLLIRALRALYTAIGGFASAALLSLIGAVLTAILPPRFAYVLESIALAAGITAVVGLVRGTILLLRETRIAVGVMEERVLLVQAEFAKKEESVATKSTSIR